MTKRREACTDGLLHFPASPNPGAQTASCLPFSQSKSGLAVDSAALTDLVTSSICLKASAPPHLLCSTSAFQSLSSTKSSTRSSDIIYYINTTISNSTTTHTSCLDVSYYYCTLLSAIVSSSLPPLASLCTASTRRRVGIRLLHLILS
jgi:hypothetical protein